MTGIGPRLRGFASTLLRNLKGVALVAVVILAFVAGMWMHSGQPAEPSGPVGASTAPEAAAPAKAEVWTCSMHPHIRKSGPGKCPLCGMTLIPVKANEKQEGGMESLRRFTTTPGAAALMEIETTPVERRFVEAEVRMVGKVAYDETQLAYITSWVSGRIDRLYVDFTGVRVNKGDHMVYLYSPELLTAQEELRRAAESLRSIRPGAASILKRTAEATVEAAREKLRLWGLTPSQIDQAESKGIVSDHVTIYAPIGGTVIHRNGQEGMYVNTGTRIYTIANMDVMWVKLDAYESDLAWLKYGQKISFETEAYPGETFTGTISFIDPFLDSKTRTVKVRVNVANPDGKLKPEMFVRAIARAKVAKGGRIMDPTLAGKWIAPMHPEIVRKEPGKCPICGMPLVPVEKLGYVAEDASDDAKPLVIPVSAALVTGTRAVVYVVVPNMDQPTYEGREIVLGSRAGDYYIVLTGLTEGEQVVTHGNFKIDSALQILAKPSMMTPEGGGGGGMMNMGSGSKSDAGAKKKSSKPGLSPVSRKQLARVWEVHDKIEEAARSLDRVALAGALGDFRAAVEAVDMSLLAGPAHMAWMEYKRRLENDAAEAGITKNPDDLKRILKGMSANLKLLAGRVGFMPMAMPEAGAPDAAAAPEAPRAFQKQLTKVVDAYLGLHNALATDDPDAAKTAVGHLGKALRGVDMTLLKGSAHDEWMARKKVIDQAMTELKSAGTLKALRTPFKPLSEALAASATNLGLTLDGSLYQAHCPMALGQGADWLQTGKEVRNPYYGSAMLSCGSITGAVHEGNAAVSRTAEAPTQGAGHKMDQ